MHTGLKRWELHFFITKSNVKVTICFKGGIIGATFNSFKDLNSNEHFLNTAILKKLLKREQLAGHIQSFLQCLITCMKDKNKREACSSSIKMKCKEFLSRLCDKKPSCTKEHKRWAVRPKYYFHLASPKPIAGPVTPSNLHNPWAQWHVGTPHTVDSEEGPDSC